MRYTLITTEFVREIQLSISISAVPVPIWCWVSHNRCLTEEDLRSTSQIIKLAFDDELALAGSASPNLWRIKEIGATKAANSIYIGNLCSSPHAAKPRLLGFTQPSKATAPATDYLNEFLFNEVHNFDVTTAKAFPLSEHLQRSTGPHSYAISLLFSAGVLNNEQYNSVNNLSRSFLTSIESYLLGLHHGTTNVVKDLISQEIHRFLCCLSQALPSDTQHSALRKSPLTPLYSVLPTAFRDICNEYGVSPPTDSQASRNNIPISHSFISAHNDSPNITLLSFKSEKELQLQLEELKSDIIASHYLKLEPTSQGIRLPGNQITCKYCILHYTEAQYKTISRLLNIYHKESARFINLILSNLCCADFRIVYFGPHTLITLLNNTVTALLPEHKRQIFKAHSICTPLDGTYCNCTDASQTLLLEHRSTVSSFNVLYIAVPDAPKDDSKRFKYSIKRTGKDQDGTAIESPFDLQESHNYKESIQSLDISHGRVCQHCKKPFYIPALHLNASSQVLSADLASGYLALQQFCAATGKPICVVNLMASDIESSCFIISLPAIQHLQKLSSQRHEKILQSKRNPLLILSSKGPSFYCDDDSIFYCHLLKKLLATTHTMRRFVLNCRLLRLQYYFSSIVELELLDYIQFLTKQPTTSPRPNSQRVQASNSSSLRKAQSVSGLSLNFDGPCNLAKVPSISKLADIQSISELLNVPTRSLNSFSRISLSAKTLYLTLPISKQRITSVCSLMEHSLCKLNSAFTLHDSNNKEEPIIHILLTNGFRSVGFPDVCLPVSDTAKWAQICSGTFSISKLSCLIRLRSNDQIITSDLIPFGVATVTNHQIVADKDEFQHTSLAMKCGILGA